MMFGTKITRTSLALVAAAALAACSDSITTPAASTSSESASALRPSAAHLTVGTTSVTTFWIDPRVDNVYQSVEGHRLVIPANSICQVGTSGYGAAYWNQSCTAASAPIQFTFTTTTNDSGYSNLTVKPDVRFSPSKQVWVFFKDAVAASTPGLVIKYCNLENVATGCVDEGITDSDLATLRDPAQGVIYRRLKHFSGYNIVFGFDGGGNGSNGGMNVVPLPMNLYSGYITTVGVNGRRN